LIVAGDGKRVADTAARNRLVDNLPQVMSATLSLPDASRYARIALANIEREFPSKLDHVIADAAASASPRALHPAFFGSFDWHSCTRTGYWCG